MEDFCDLVDRSTYDENIQEIMRIFNSIMAGKEANDLVLLNYYNGVPISYKTSLVEVKNDTVTLTLHPNQAVVLGKTLKTFIKSSYFRKDVLADVFVLTPKLQEVCLRNFIFTDVLSTKRKYIRVDMADPTEIRLSIDNQVVVGKLMDISLVSIAVALPDDLLLAPETRASIVFRLTNPSDHSFVDVRAEAVYLKKVQTEQSCKHIFIMTESKINEPVISQYLIRRQIEIMKKIKELHWAL